MRPTRHRFALAIALALVPPSFAVAAEPLPRGLTAGPSVEGISQYELPNGMKVLLFPDASKATVTVNLVYGVGSAQENYGETGMAHLLEHLLFKGTPTQSDISGEMKKRGIGFNATTSLDRTNYFSSFPANEDTLAWLIGMEADRMVHSNIARKDLDTEMTVVRNELERGENDPFSVMFQRLRSTAYLWHNYGNSTIGARSDVEAVPIDKLQAFYRQWYQPDNAVLIIAGRIDPAKTLQLVSARFGKLARPERSLPHYYTAEPAQDGEREVTVRRAGDMRALAAAYHIPALTHADSAPLKVLGNVLGNTPGGRLHKAMVETKIAAIAGAGDESMHDPGLLTVIAVVPKDGDPAKAEAELLAQVEGLGKRPITQQEVDEAKQRLANNHELTFTNVNGVGMLLSEFQAAGDWRLIFTTRDAVAKVTVGDVNRVAATYLQSSNRTLGRFVPTDNAPRAEIVAAPPAAKIVDGYVGRAAVAGGESFDPSPQNLQARTQTFTLGNGLKVSLLPKKTRGETVVVNARFRFGDEKSITGRTDAGDLAGAMLMRGSGKLTRQQIDKRFEDLKTKAGIGGSSQAANISLTSRKSQLADALALAAEVLRNPSFPESEFEQLRLQSITFTEASRKEPGSVAGLALAQHFDPWPVGHPLHARTLDESLAALKALKIEDLRAFHRDFYGTGNGEIAIVGDFDPIVVKQQLESLFAGWTSSKPYEAIDTHYTSVPAASKRFETPDKPNAVLLAQHNLPLKVSDPDYAAIMVANNILGGGALKSRLGDRIRQKEGLSYGVQSTVRADDSSDGKDDAGAFSIQAIAAPQNMAKVETAIREELARLVRDGVSADELRDAVSGVVTQRERARAEDGYVAGMLSDQLYFGRTMEFTAALDARLKALTVEQVNAAIRKFLKPETLSVYVAGQFAGGASSVGAAGK